MSMSSPSRTTDRAGYNTSHTSKNGQPDRDLSLLSGYLSPLARYEESDAYGPGLYADAKVLPGYVDFTKSAAPVIGISHYCEGST